MNMIIYLKYSRLGAVADWYGRVYGLETPMSAPMFEAVFLPDTRPAGGPECHRKYYDEGGTNWPDRWIVREREVLQ